MENTPKNKANFFSKYLGQKVIPQDCDQELFRLTEISLIDEEIGVWGDWSGGTNPEKSCNDVLSINDAYLELKPLSGISDEDVIKCYHIYCEIAKYDYTQDFKPIDVTALHWLNKGGFEECLKYTKLSNYLCSMGYYVGNGEELRYGWTKLKSVT